MAKIALKLEQKTKLSQIQRLTIQMLTLHAQDLTDFLHEQVTDNPLLDIRYKDVRPSGGSGKEKPIDNIKNRGDSLETGLMKQLRVQNVPKSVMLAAGLVIRSLDEKGFFTGNLDLLGQDYALSLEDMEKGLALVQSFDPPGIGARSICEALLIQTRRHDDAPPRTEELLQDHYQEFLTGKWQKLQKEMELSNTDLQAIRDFLKTLALQPAGQAETETEFVRPDVEIYTDESGHLAVRSLEELPEVFFREDLYKEYEEQGDKKTRTYIHKARRAFLDLQSALAYRWQSIFTVMDCIIRHQEGHFLYGDTLQPLRQKDIAAETGLSTATVSRVCHGRYVLFDRRTYAIQDFFAQSYRRDSGADGEFSDQAIRQKMAELIEFEDGAHPYSDQELADHFAAADIHIARRTITKFRLKMHIPNSSIRRRLKNG